MNYNGNELTLFAGATNWKRYWSSRVKPYVRGDVLEVGSGIGANISHLYNDKVTSWTALEPDPALLEQARQNVSGYSVSHIQGTLETVDPEQQFDCLVYIDVLEHIEHDNREMQAAVERLRPGGFLVVLVPAFQFLYSPYDAAIGHYRRYNRPSLVRVIPAKMQQTAMFYLDSAGMALSLANRLFLRHSEPKPAQIAFWDRYVIPVSRILDSFIFHSVGRSLIGVWTLQ